MMPGPVIFDPEAVMKYDQLTTAKFAVYLKKVPGHLGKQGSGDLLKYSMLILLLLMKNLVYLLIFTELSNAKEHSSPL